MKKHILPAVFALLAANASFAQGSFEALTDYTPSATTAPVTGTGGWTFRPLEAIEVTDLGSLAFVVADQGPIVIGLWEDNGTLLVSRTIYSTNSPVNQSRYVSIPSLFLAAGQTYHIGAYSPTETVLLNLIEPGFPDGGSATLGSQLQLGAYAYGSPGFVFPGTLGHDNAMLLGPNFLYRTIPEPSAVALFWLGGCGALVAARARRRV